MEYYILNDPDLTFKDILKRHLCGEPLVEKKEEKKQERKEKKSEEKVEKEEKKEGDKEEKKEEEKEEKKKSPAAKKSRKSDSKKEEEKSSVKDEEMDEGEKEKEKETEEETEKKDGDKEEVKMEVDEEEKKEEKEKTSKVETKKEEKEKEKKDETSMPAPTMTPERRKICVSIQPPQITLAQMEQMMAKGSKYDVELMNDLMAQTYASAIKWPKDVILQVRLEHIIKCVETDSWPVQKNYPLGDHLLTNSRAASPDREAASTPISESGLSDLSFDETSVPPSSHGAGSRKRRGRQPAVATDDNPMDHSPKIRSLLTGAITSSVSPTKNPLGLSVDAFLLESNQQNLAER